jgi:hypothetical protein
MTYNAGRLNIIDDDGDDDEAEEEMIFGDTVHR